MKQDSAYQTSFSLHHALRWAYGSLLLSLPFSIGVDLGNFELNLPSEPILAILSILLVVWFFQNGFLGQSFRKAPFTLIGLALIYWMAFTTLFSSMPFTSSKYVLVAAVHWWVGYIGFFVVVRRLPQHLFYYLLAYALPFAGIMIYAWTVHAQYQFSIDSSVLAARPFYFDHALYSSCLLLLIGPFGYWAVSIWPKAARWVRIISGILVLLFAIGIYLSFSRAAWLSTLLSAGIIGGILIFRLRFKGLMIGAGIIVGGFLLLLPQLIHQAQSNTAESKTSDIIDQIISIGNISTDVSNLERVNRYSCAWRMFKDRPITGFGPGTYQFAYLPYQLPEQMTRISVTHAGPHGPGRGGGAHSEYLQALSETGLPGALLWLGLLFTTFASALSTFYRSSQHRWLAISLLFSLLTYFIHSVFNNFLHHDKVAILFWGSLAALTLLEKEATSVFPSLDES